MQPGTKTDPSGTKRGDGGVSGRVERDPGQDRTLSRMPTGMKSRVI